MSHHPLPDRKASSLRPKGHLLELVHGDLEKLVGPMDERLPDLITNDDIYGKDRLSSRIKRKDLKAVNQDANCEVEFLWWNSETQCNWLDGLIRLAWLADDYKFKIKATACLERVFASQDEDGYIGIYDDELRFKSRGENGELWAQTTFLRAALAAFRHSGKRDVLDKVLRAFHTMRENYRRSGRNPFDCPEGGTGVGHGLMITDVAYELYKITGETSYLEDATWLFECFEKSPLPFRDIRSKQLTNPAYRFHDHAAHTYEHIRALAYANFATAGRYDCALLACLTKLNYCLSPSGGPIGDEFINGRSADATSTGYEYCSMQEILHTKTVLFELDGDAAWGDRIEWLYYNAARGARDPGSGQLAYCKTDNSFAMNGCGGGSGVEYDPRYKYSFTHRDVAVCCAPNAGRILPYFLDAMYHPSDEGLSILLYGPSEFDFSLRGKTFSVRQSTDYPFETTVRLQVQAAGESDIKLRLRVPQWCSGLETSGPPPTVAEGWAIFETFPLNEEITLYFRAKIDEYSDLKGDLFYGFGPLLLALPIQAQQTLEEGDAGCGDRRYTAIETGFHAIRSLPEKTRSSICQSRSGASFEDPPVFTGDFYDEALQEIRNVELRPMGSTVLRKATFQRSAPSPTQ